MNCDSCEEPKNSFTAAATGLALIISCGISGSVSAIVRRSFTARSTRTSPTRKAFSAISPTLAHAAVAEVIDVVHLAVAVTDVDQHLQHVDDVGHVAVLRDQALGQLVRAACSQYLRVVEDAGAE